ncbi:hypothetical protein [Endozoicomonas atrinae]|uniref:hypothetical protein n=1 Tax=Endozoicomonas atrinae TaxID=1333660 RepID=UPI000B1C6B0F|nr:hypothetical protein [Endozoicomonas atrinae]
MTEQKEKKQRKPMRTYPKRLPKDYKMSPIQKVVRKYRVRRRFTRNRLSAASGVFSRTIEQYETNNLHNPRILHLAAVLNVLDLDLWVIDRTNGTLVERIY